MRKLDRKKNYLHVSFLNNPEAETVWLLKPLITEERCRLFADMENLLTHLKSVDPDLERCSYEIKQFNDSEFFL
jgi:hypothetical protein